MTKGEFLMSKAFIRASPPLPDTVFPGSDIPIHKRWSIVLYRAHPPFLN